MVESLYIIPDAPRLALLSDLHGRPYQEAVFSLQRNKPNIICITGDIIYGIWPSDDISPLVSQPYVLSFLERCAGIAPTYLSLGNHAAKKANLSLNEFKDQMRLRGFNIPTRQSRRTAVAR